MEQLLSTGSMNDRESFQARRDALIEECRTFVETVVDRLISRMNLPRALRAEFVSAGYLGLVEAAERFDETRCPDFRGYAFLRIRGAIIDSVRAGCDVTGRAYRILRALEAANEIALAELTGNAAGSRQRNGRKLTHALEYLSKSALAYRLEGIGHGVTSYSEKSPDPEEELSLKRESERLRHLVAVLPEKERTIIEQYYFQGKRFNEIAIGDVNRSKSWVSRLHARALKLLREQYEKAIQDPETGALPGKMPAADAESSKPKPSRSPRKRLPR